MSRLHSNVTDLSTTEKALLAELQDERASRQALEQQVVLLQERIAWFNQQMFGRSSEKTPAQDIDPKQGTLFNEVELIAEQIPNADPAVVIPAHKRRKKGRKRIPEDLPRVDMIHDLAEDAKRCGNDGQPLKKIGEVVSEQLDFVPAKVRVLRHVRYKYVCGHCDGAPITADKPSTLLPKSLASPSLLAHITTAKYVDSLPLHRQERQFERLGVQLHRATMAQWMMKIGATLVQPLINRLNDECRDSPLLHMDETQVQVLKSDKAPSAQHWIWVRASGLPKRRVVLFDYDPSRGEDAPKRLLEDFKGILLSDGYHVYDRIAAANELTHAGCMAHVRRRFHDAKKIAGHDQSQAKQALAYIGELYRIERQLKQKHQQQSPPPTETEIAKNILQARAEQSAAIVKDFKVWLMTMQPKVPPQSALGKAVSYTLNQWPKLTTFLDYAEVPLDNNRAEQCIRPFVIGRKNWVFCCTQTGARASANLYSLVATAKANGLEPHAYLTQVYQQLPSASGLDDIDTLLP